MTLPTRVLQPSGLRLTEASFGCAGIAGLYRACPEAQAMDTLQAAWDGGIRYFDTAPFYGAGLSEQRLGRFLADKPRAQVVVSTKVGRLLDPVSVADAPDYGFVGGLPARVRFDYSGAGIRASLADSLARSGLDRFDILYVHDIGGYAHGTEAARHWADFTASGIAALNALKAEGVIKAWGLGVNEVEVCLDLLAIEPVEVILLAGRYTLLDRRAEAALLPRLRDCGGSLVVGGVYNSGILATGAVPGAMFDYAPAAPEIMARVAGISERCEARGQDRLAAALQFPLADPQVASVLIGSAVPRSLLQNLTLMQQPVDAAIFAEAAEFAL